MAFLSEQHRWLRLTLAGVALAGATAPSCGDGFTESGSGGSGGTSGAGVDPSAVGAGSGAPATSAQAGTGGQKDAVCNDPADCDDGDPCTADTCEEGTCVSSTVDVDDHDACTVDACDPTVGTTHTPVNTDDGDPCTTDTCDPVTGVSHGPLDPNDNNPCTMDLCDPDAGPNHAPVSIDDGNACTVDACDPVLGVTHDPIDMHDDNPCTFDSCDPATGVAHTLISVDDGNACTTDTCDPVLGVKHTPLNPDDGDMCTVDSCSAATGPKHVPITCNDNNICTTDLCNPLAGCFSMPTIYFAEGFSNNMQGWMLGPEWEIGPTSVSSGQGLGWPDPLHDHTPGPDNGVAGVNIGGNALAQKHDYSWLTSPVINLVVPTPVTLEFYRWLNSDHTPFMENKVEVFDGFNWQTLFVSGGLPDIGDHAWQKYRYDVTAYKNANFRVRFGFKVGSSNVFVVSGWNVDDIRLIPGPNCP